jgi:hypothetical protein
MIKDKIDLDTYIDNNFVSKMFDYHCGRELSRKLHSRGWKTEESRSMCSVASYETLLTNGTLYVKIIDSSFMGSFTQVSVYPVH